MARLAIISTYNENCGNASYTHVLKKAFEKHVEVDVISLDLFLIQKKGSVFRKAAHNHFREIAERLKQYDYVNIQFEAGLYGSTNADRLRHIKMLIDAAPNLTLTMHRLDIRQQGMAKALSHLIFGRSFRKFDRIYMDNKYADMYKEIVDYCNLKSKVKNVWIKVHTKRERRVLKEIFGFDNCFDYPLVFLNEVEKSQSWERRDRSTFMRRHRFADGDKIIGLFGYLSGYKGIETALKSLSLLPDNYKLALFGSQHPQTIRPNVEIDPYLNRLLEKIENLEEDGFQSKLKEQQLALDSKRQTDKSSKIPVSQMPNILERVRFMGSLADPEFIEALRLCDVVVLPYIEVGQSMSGVVVLAMEAGSKMLCANNLSFIETKKYFGDVYATFDIGNFSELAQKAKAIAEDPLSFEFADNRKEAFAEFNIENSIALQLEKFQHQRLV